VSESEVLVVFDLELELNPQAQIDNGLFIYIYNQSHMEVRLAPNSYLISPLRRIGGVAGADI
jgi:hypothetical protein